MKLLVEAPICAFKSLRGQKMHQKESEYGSVDWFAEARLRVFEQANALFHMHTALEASNRLLHDFAKADELLSSALFRSLVIEYSKPFTSSRGSRTYQLKNIRNHPGVNREIHEEILSIRNKLVAHQDDDFTDRVLMTACASVEADGMAVHFPAAMQFSGLFLSSVSDKALLERFIEHIKACYEAIGIKSKSELERFREAVSENYANFIAFSEDARFRVKSPPENLAGGLIDVPQLKYSIDLNTPNLQNRNGYLYRVYSLNYTKSGKITAVDEAGNIHEATISDINLSSGGIPGGEA